MVSGVNEDEFTITTTATTEFRKLHRSWKKTGNGSSKVWQKSCSNLINSTNCCYAFSDPPSRWLYSFSCGRPDLSPVRFARPVPPHTRAWLPCNDESSNLLLSLVQMLYEYLHRFVRLGGVFAHCLRLAQYIGIPITIWPLSGCWCIRAELQASRELWQTFG